MSNWAHLAMMALTTSAALSASAVELSLTHGQRTQTNLPDLPGRLVRGDLNLRPAWYWAVSAAKPLWQSNQTLNSSWKMEIEGRLLQHYGGQRHLESAGAFVLRSPCWSLKLICAQAAVGEGLSWAWQPPALERGKQGKTGIDTYQLQNYLLFELALSGVWRERWASNWQLLMQIHHRSGIYGVISPRKTGSNYLALGIRWRAQ